MGFFVKACVQALKEIPAVNAEIDGADLIYKNYYHVGIAVGTERGLVVPVVRDCDQKSIAEIEKEIAGYGKRARDGQLKIEEMQGGTFTITNGGVYGSLMSTPILNAPQSGILGMHKIQERPMVIGGKIEVRPMMYLALSLRSPHRRRPRGGDVPRAGQGMPGGPGAARAGSLKWRPIFGIVQIIARWGQRKPEISEIWIFGSRARRDNCANSDLDIAISLLGDRDRRFNVWFWQFENWRLELQALLP